MTKSINFSIKKKLVLIIFLVAATSLIAAFSIITIITYNQSKNLLINDAKIHARLIAEYAISPIMFDDFDGLQEIINKAETLPSAQSAAIYNNKRVLMVSYVRDNSYQPSKYEQRESEELKDFIHVREEIVYEDQVYGSLHLIVSMKSMKKNVMSVWVNLFLIIIVMGFLAYFLAYKFQKIISLPIIKLSKTAREISDKKDYSTRLEKESNDEIGELYDSFNEMLNQIQTQISETNSAHEASIKQYKRFLTILNSFYDAVYISDPESYEILFANDAMKDLYGPYIVGKKCYEVLMEAKGPCSFCDVEALLTSEKTIVKEQYNDVVGKHLFIIDKLIRWPDERIVRLQQLRDITKRKNAEKRLKVYQEDLESLVEERTEELQKANDKLAKSIEDIKDLNKLFVGREFRIKELRDKIRKLENSQKEKMI